MKVAPRASQPLSVQLQDVSSLNSHDQRQSGKSLKAGMVSPRLTKTKYVSSASTAPRKLRLITAKKEVGRRNIQVKNLASEESAGDTASFIK